MSAARRRYALRAQPSGRLLLGALQTLVGAGVVREADAPAAAEHGAAADSVQSATHGHSTREEFITGAARVTRLAPIARSCIMLDYERGVLDDVDAFLDLVGETPDGLAPELDYQLTWAGLSPAAGSGCPPLIRLEIKLASVPRPVRLVIEAEHQPTLWHLSTGAELAIAFARDGSVGLGLGPLPDRPALAQILAELAVPVPAPALRPPAHDRRPR
jgi:hypothetical protein